MMEIFCMTHTRGLGDRAPGSRGSIHRRDRERLKANTSEWLGMGGFHSRPPPYRAQQHSPQLRGLCLCLKGRFLEWTWAQGTGLGHRHLGNRHSSPNVGKTLFLETGFHLAC